MVMRNYPLSLLLVALLVSLAGKAAGSVTALKEERDRLGQAQKAYRQSHPEKAIKLAEQARQQINAKKNPEQHLKASFRKIHYLIRHDQPYSYEALIRSTFEKSKAFRTEKPLLYVRGLYYKAWFKLASASGKEAYQQALALLEKGLSHKAYLDEQYPEDLIRIQLLHGEASDKLDGKYHGQVTKAFQYTARNKLNSTELRADVLSYYARKLKKQGKVDSAIRFHRQAIDLLQQHFSRHHFLIYQNCLGLIDIMRNQDQDEQLKKYCNLAYAVIRANDREGTEKEVAVLVNRGKYEMARIRYYKARKFLQRAVNIIHRNEEVSASSNNYYFRTNGILAQCYIRLDKPQKAVTLCRKAMSELYKDQLTPTDKRIRAALQGTLAYALQQNQQYDSALSYHRKVLRFSKAIGIPNNMQSSYVNMANVFMQQGNYPKAIEYIQKTASLYERTSRPKGSDYARIVPYNLAVCYLNQQQYDKAIKKLQQGLMFNASGFQGEAAADFPVTDQVLNYNVGHQLAYRKGKALMGKYNQSKDPDFLRLALKSFQLADSCLQSLRAANILGKNPISIAEVTSHIYPPAVNTCYSLIQHSDSLAIDQQAMARAAYRLSEKNRGFVLSGEMAKAQVKESRFLPDSLVEQVQETALKLNKLKSQIRKTGETDKKAKLQKKRTALIQERDNQFRRIRNSYPDFYQQKFRKQAEPLSHIQQALDKQDKNMVEYVIGGSYAQGLVITPDKVKLVALPTSDTVRHLIQSFRQKLVDGEDHTYNQELAYDLYHQLFEPLEPHLTSRNLVVIPDGTIGHLPFSALLTAKDAEEPVPYLVRDYAISYSPSATLWHTPSKQTTAEVSEERVAYAGYAPDFRSEASLTVMRGNEDTFRNSLSPIPGAKAELRLGADLWKTRTFYNEQATEARFKETAPDSRVIHLATHGIINQQNPAYNKLLFATDSASGEDGNLYSYEIQNMDLDADLAVLSACRTGYGEVIDGEGVMSLARGFKIAGCKNIMMTLWPVEDRSGAKLTKAFYRNLNEGLSKKKALQEAKLAYLDSESELGDNPFYWAGYVMMGSNTPVPRAAETHSNILWIGLAGALLLLSPLAIQWWRQNRKAGKKP